MDRQIQLSNNRPAFWFAHSTFLISVLVIVALVWNFGRHEQYSGWAILIFAAYFLSLTYACLLFGLTFDRALTVVLPHCFLLVCLVPLILSMRHPPFMVGAGFEWPPFESFGERLVHAFFLSIWQLFWAPIAILCAGVVIEVGERIQAKRQT